MPIRSHLISPRRRLLLTTLAGALPLPLAHAHSDHANGTPVRTTASADTVTVVGPWDLIGLDPSRAGYMFSRMEVTETLLDVDDTGQLRPALAQRWTVSGDQLQWRFSLRRNSRYHDGTPVTPQSVLQALQRAQARPGVLQLADIRRMAINGNELVITLGKRFAPLPYLFTHATTQVLAPASFDAKGNVKQIIGSGPYRISAMALPQQFDVERFDDYVGNLPTAALPVIRHARYISVSRAETRTLLIQSGQADIAFSLDPPSIRQLQHSKQTQLLSTLLPRTTYLKLNAGHPFLNDVRVRQAISFGIDRSGIATALLRDPGLAATQLFPPAMRQWHQSELTPLQTNPAMAHALLQQAGWRPGKDGVLSRHDQRFELTLQTFVDRPELPLIAAAVQEQLRQLGIAVRVVIGNSSDIPAGHRSGTLAMGLATRNFGNLPDPVASLLQDFGANGADWGAMNWSDPQVVGALQRLASDSRNASEDRALVTSTLQRELPLIPIAWSRQTSAISQRLRGASIDPYERSYRLSQLKWAT